MPSCLHPFIANRISCSRYLIPFLLVSQRLNRIQLGGLGGWVPAADDAYNGADDKAQEDPQPWYGEGRFHEDG